MDRAVIHDMVKNGEAEHISPYTADMVDGMIFHGEEALAAAQLMYDNGLYAQATKNYWEAARILLEAFLGYQGVRVLGESGHHKAVIRLARATHLGSMPDVLDNLDMMRERRNRLSYINPDRSPAPPAQATEVKQYADIVGKLYDNVAVFLDNLRVIS